MTTTRSMSMLNKRLERVASTRIMLCLHQNVLVTPVSRLADVLVENAFL